MVYRTEGQDVRDRERKSQMPTSPIGLSMAMLQAGAAAIREWDSEQEEPELLAVEVFYRMLAKSDFQAKC